MQLLDAVLKVQRKFRDHRSWKQMVKWENIMVVAKANKLRDDYLFGVAPFNLGNQLIEILAASFKYELMSCLLFLSYCSPMLRVLSFAL